MALKLYLLIQIHFLNGFFLDLNVESMPSHTLLPHLKHTHCVPTRFHGLPNLFCSHCEYFQLNNQNANYWHSSNFGIPINFRSLLDVGLFLSILWISWCLEYMFINPHCISKLFEMVLSKILLFIFFLYFLKDEMFNEVNDCVIASF